MNLNKPAVIKKLQERFRNVNAGRGLYTAFLVPTMLTMFSTRAFAADTIWTKASAIMQDVYTQILGISTIAAVVTAAIALLLMNFSRSGRTVDESRAWLKRIIITWAILNIWKNGIMTREEAYRWFADSFGLSLRDAHIGMCSEYRCRELIRLCNEVLARNNCVA